MKTIAVEDAVGTILCHDVTRIIPGDCKEVAFRRGHHIVEKDIPEFLAIGKEHLYIYDPADGYLHEDEAAQLLVAAIAGEGVVLTEPKEGKITLSAAWRGVLTVNVEALLRINLVGEVICSTIHTGQLVEADRNLAGVRVIPLVIEQEQLDQVVTICKECGPIISVQAITARKVGIVTTGSEIYHGRISDAFAPILRKKMAYYDCEVLGQKIVSDDQEMTVAAIEEFIDFGADMVVVTGGMSVDPDDLTPASIQKTGAEVIRYGAPVLPGAMFMLARRDKVMILGLPGCVMYHSITILDLLLPKILAGIPIDKRDIALLGHGGFCEDCDQCHYPRCGFGK